MPPNHHICISLQSSLASAQANPYPSRGNLNFPAPSPQQCTVKLCCTTSLPGSQHNRMLERRRETETSWIFSLSKDKGISSTFLLKAVSLCFVLGRGCSQAYLWCLPASVFSPLFTAYGAAYDIVGWALCPLPGLGQMLAVVQHKWHLQNQHNCRHWDLTVRYFPFLYSVNVERIFSSLVEGRLRPAVLLWLPFLLQSWHCPASHSTIVDMESSAAGTL